MSLPECIPEIDPCLELVDYSSLIKTRKDVYAKLANKIPKDEKDIFKTIILSLNASLSNIFKKSINTSKKLTSSLDCANSFMQKIYKYVIYICPKPSFDKEKLEFDNCIVKGPFYGTLYKSGDEYVIDSVFMNKYSYKKGVIVPAIKACFLYGENGKLKLTSINHKGIIHTDETSSGFKNAKRLLFNYLLIDTVVFKHLVIGHFKITQTCSIAVRRYLNKENPMKAFLWNFVHGVNTINKATNLLLGDGIGSIAKFFPFTEDGLIDYTNDCIKKDCSEDIFPDNSTDLDVKESMKADCKKIFTIYKKFVKEMIQSLDSSNLSEIYEMCSYISSNVEEYKTKNPTEIITSFIFVSSIFHDVKSDIFEYITQGYDCPVSVYSDMSVRETEYILSLIVTLFTTIPMRSLFLQLPESYDTGAGKIYKNLCDDLLNLDLHCINIKCVDSSVQI